MEAMKKDFSFLNCHGTVAGEEVAHMELQQVGHKLCSLLSNPKFQKMFDTEWGEYNLDLIYMIRHRCSSLPETMSTNVQFHMESTLDSQCDSFKTSQSNWKFITTSLLVHNRNLAYRET